MRRFLQIHAEVATTGCTRTKRSSTAHPEFFRQELIEHPWQVSGIGNPHPQGPTEMKPDPKCPFCKGKGEVIGVVDDVEFRSICSCVGGDEEWVKRLLGVDDDVTPDWII